MSDFNVNRVQVQPTGTVTNAQTARMLEQRRGELSRVGDMSVKLHRCSGFVTVQDAGEVPLDVYFPVHFVERPGMSFGGELAEGHSPEETNFPTVSVVVLRWIKRERGTLSEWYVGANLGIVTTGRENHQMIVHWHAEGKAMVNPLNTSGDTAGTL